MAAMTPSRREAGNVARIQMLRVLDAPAQAPVYAGAP